MVWKKSRLYKLQNITKSGIREKIPLKIILMIGLGET